MNVKLSAIKKMCIKYKYKEGTRIWISSPALGYKRREQNSDGCQNPPQCLTDLWAVLCSLNMTYGQEPNECKLDSSICQGIWRKEVRFQFEFLLIKCWIILCYRQAIYILEGIVQAENNICFELFEYWKYNILLK